MPQTEAQARREVLSWCVELARHPRGSEPHARRFWAFLARYDVTGVVTSETALRQRAALRT